MERLLNFLLRSGDLFVFAVCEVVCLILIVNFNSHQEDIWLETTAVYLGSFQEWCAGWANYLDLDERNAVLERENAYLRGQLPSANYELGERADSTVDSVRLQRFNYLATRVVNRSPGGPNNTLVIDRGREFQVTTGQGVVGGEGLLGIVDRVTARYARVLSILHLDVRISAGLAGGAYGTLRWDGRDPRYMSLSDIPDYLTVSPDRDTVYTTGFSSVFPTGVPIGTVSGAERVPGTGSQTLRVRLLGEPLLARHGYVVRDLFKDQLDQLNRGS